MSAGRTGAQIHLWDAPKADVPSQSPDKKEGPWTFSESTRRDLTHGLHPWPAKFIPDIPARAIDLFSGPGDTVLDPFCGSGTTALEALRRRRGFVMSDVNPFAIRVTEGKCEVPRGKELVAIKAWATRLRACEVTEGLLAAAPAIPNLGYWFTPGVTAQLVSLRNEVRALGLAQAFLEVVLSSIIVNVSNQESETRYRRVPKTVTANEVLNRFRHRLDLALGMAIQVGALLDTGLTRRYLTLDARGLIDAVSTPVDLAVFSPPYPNAFDYHLYHRFRMFWLGYDPRLVKHREIGAHLRYEVGHTRWLSDMEAAFRSILEILRRGGHVVCVVGDGVSGGKQIPSGDLLWDSARAWGYSQVSRSARPVPLHRKAFNLSDSRLREEHVLVFSR